MQKNAVQYDSRDHDAACRGIMQVELFEQNVILDLYNLWRVC